MIECQCNRIRSTHFQRAVDAVAPTLPDERIDTLADAADEAYDLARQLAAGDNSAAGQSSDICGICPNGLITRLQERRRALIPA